MIVSATERIRLSGYRVLNIEETESDFHFHVEAPELEACEQCGAKGALVKYGNQHGTSFGYIKRGGESEAGRPGYGQ